MKKFLTDRRKSIYLFLLLFISYSLIYMTKNCYSAAMASIVANGIMTKSQTGLIAALFYLIYAPFQIIGGIAADKYSPAKLILYGTFGAGLCNSLVYVFSENYVAMLIIWSLNAAIQFGIWPSIFKIVVSQLAPEHRMRGIFFILLTPSAGLALSYASAVFITDWRFNFLLSAIILFAIVPIFFFIYRYIEKSMTVENDTNKKEVKAEKIQGASLVRKIIISGIPILLIIYVVQGLLSIGIKSLVPVMLMESYDLTPSLANGLNVILVLCGPLGTLLGALPLFKKFSYTTTITILFGLSLPAVFIITYVGSIPAAVIIIALIAVTVFMAATSVYFSYTSRVFEKFGFGGTLSGLYNCMSAIGLVLSNYVFTSVAENFGWSVTTNTWLIMLSLALVLLCITIPIWKRFMKSL